MSGAALGYDTGFSLVIWIPSHAFRESRPLTHYNQPSFHKSGEVERVER
jgi:hypothetical protein